MIFLRTKGLPPHGQLRTLGAEGEVSGVKRKHDTNFPAACLEPLKGELVVTRMSEKPGLRNAMDDRGTKDGGKHRERLTNSWLTPNVVCGDDSSPQAGRLRRSELG